MCVPSAALGAGLAAEWDAQSDVIDYAAMPLTRLSNAAIDRVAARAQDVRAELAGFINSDLISYWAEGPDSLAARQSDAFGPILDWASETLGARLSICRSITPVQQSPATHDAIVAAIGALDPFRLLVASAMAGHTSSVLLGLACVRRRLGFAQAFEISRIEEIWQNERWGVDAEASERTSAIAAEISDLETFHGLLDA